MIRILFTLLSAVAYGAALPPWNVPGLAWVGLIPFLYALHDTSPRRAFALGLLWGIAANCAIGFWVPSAIAFYYLQSYWFVLLFCIGTSLVFFAPYYALFAGGAGIVKRRAHGIPRAILLAALWVACELGRAHLMTGAPWLLQGYALLSYPLLAQTADLGGPYILSFIVVLVNVALTDAVLKWMQRGGSFAALTAAATVWIVACTYGAMRLASPLPADASVPISVIQGNNVVGAHWIPGSYGEGLDEYLRLSLEAVRTTNARLIIWPEAAVPVFLGREESYRSPIEQMLRATGAELIVGAPHYEDIDSVRPQYFNSAFHFTANGLHGPRYDKVHLMPFTEYFPLRTIELLRRNFEQVRMFSPGSVPMLLETRIGKVAVVICFEGDFPEVARARMQQGAKLLVNLSNDVWLGSVGQRQHLAMVALRAIENRTWLVRATTTGISAIIDPFGNIRVRTDTDSDAVMSAEVVPLQVATFYKEYGDLFAHACVAASAIALALARSGQVPETSGENAERVQSSHTALFTRVRRG